jgi:hypothetical protein
MFREKPIKKIPVEKELDAETQSMLETILDKEIYNTFYTITLPEQRRILFENQAAIEKAILETDIFTVAKYLNISSSNFSKLIKSYLPDFFKQNHLGTISIPEELLPEIYEQLKEGDIISEILRKYHEKGLKISY